MGEASRRCKDRDQRIQMAIEREIEERKEAKQKELERIAKMTSEEREAELNKKQRLSKARSLLASALVLTKNIF